MILAKPKTLLSHNIGYTKKLFRMIFNSYNEGETQINLKGVVIYD